MAEETMLPVETEGDDAQTGAPESGLFDAGAGKPVDGGLLSGVVDLIAEEFAPKTETFPVTILMRGQAVVFQFRRFTDGAEMEKLQKDAVKWAQDLMPKKVLKGTRIKPMSPAMKEWFVPDPVVLAKVYVVTRLALHPDFQNEALVMRLYRQAWPIFNGILAQIDLGATNRIGEIETADYEDEKKGSRQTRSIG